jgi:hypothetical protein
MSAMHLQKWQDAEKSELRGLCAEHGILYLVLPFAPMLFDRAARLIENFRLHAEDENIRSAEERLDTIMENSQGPLEKMLVMDADRTLSATDTGDLFWKHMACLSSLTCVEDPMKTIFSSLHYSHPASTAWLQCNAGAGTSRLQQFPQRRRMFNDIEES